MALDGVSLGLAKAYLARFFPQEFKVYRKARTFDGQGGFEEMYAETTKIRGRMSTTFGKVVARETSIGAKWPAEVDHIFFTQSENRLKRHDVLEAEDGRRFRVIAFREPSLLGIHLEAGCEELILGL